MVSENKHFSHTHKLAMHEMPQGAEVICSGCNSSANKTIYICWQCNFFLHEQCFHATRLRKHPSHPQHSLTLVPYPTYPSNSFYCNSCKIIGTGFSYSCADCNFDLHVHCAYSISSAIDAHQPLSVTSPHPNNTFYPNQQTMPPHFHGNYSSMVANVSSVSIPSPIPVSGPIPFHAQYPQGTPQTHNIAYPNQEIVPSHMHAHNSSTVSSVATNSVPIPRPIPSASPVYAQYPKSTTQESNYISQTVTQISVPSGAQNPITGSANPITNAQNTCAPQHFSSVPTSTQNSSSAHNNTNVFVPPSAPNDKLSHFNGRSQNRTKNQGIKHFSHPHGLLLVNLKRGKRQIVCSGCQDTLVGKGYACVEKNCGFQLDETCFNLEKEIYHKSHPSHPLFLLFSTPYDNQNDTFTCNACFNDGSGFTYHCSICQHDLHVKCASLKETVKRDDHDHELKLFFECPLKGEDYTFYCDVCYQVVPRDHWTYYCKVCDYGTHLDCVDREECDETSDPDVGTLEEVMETVTISAICRKNMLDNV